MSSIFVICVISLVLLSSPTEGVKCTYEVDPRDGSYSCTLYDQIIRGESDLVEITGDHLPEYSDERVHHLIGRNSTIEIFPSALVDKFEYLKQVWLASNKIKNFQHPIRNCNNLVTINLNFNEISTLPGGIFANCANLVNLYLMGNSMSTIDNNAFNGLNKLERLELQRNNITTLNASLFAPIFNLEFLDLHSNQISVFPEEIFDSLKVLKGLFLNNNKFTTWSTKLPTMHPSVEVLNLADNEIKNVDPDAFTSLFKLDELLVGGLLEEVPILNGLRNLTLLSLDNNKIKNVSLESFRNYPSLRQLHLSHNQIESVNFTGTTSNILSQLQVLFVVNNKIQNLPVNSFTALTLTHLNVQANELKKLEAIDLKAAERLRVLDVSYNKIEKIERDLFRNMTNSVDFRATGNICVNNDYTITRDFDSKVAPLLEKCFNFGVMTHANVIVLIAAVLLSIFVK